MDLSTIMVISGKPGLFKMVSEGKNSIIVESIADKKRFPAFASKKISTLGDISIYTTDGDSPLKEILKVMHELSAGKELENLNDDKAIREYFKQVLPNHDEERVYVSDIKKIIRWYNELLKYNLLDFTEESEEKSNNEEEGKDETDDAKVKGKAKQTHTTKSVEPKKIKESKPSNPKPTAAVKKTTTQVRKTSKSS